MKNKCLRAKFGLPMRYIPPTDRHGTEVDIFNHRRARMDTDTREYLSSYSLRSRNLIKSFWLISFVMHSVIHYHHSLFRHTLTL